MTCTSNLQKQIKYRVVLGTQDTLICVQQCAVLEFSIKCTWLTRKFIEDSDVVGSWKRATQHFKSISCGAQFVKLENISQPRLLFFNSTHKTKTGTANRWETTNSDPPRPIKLSSQSTVGVRLCCALLPASANRPTKMLGQNHFAHPNWHTLTFLYPILQCRATYWAPLEMLLEHLGISSSAQYGILQKCFSHPSLVILFFSTPPIKLKLGQQIGGELPIANHLDQLLWWSNQKPWAAVRSYL